MKYVISVFYDDAEVDVKTNDVEIAILEMLKADKTGNHAHVVDGFTGEVLALVNSPDGERHCTEEFALMTLGFLFKMEQEASEEEEAECVDCEREIIPSIFEVMSTLARQQAEEILGPQESDPVEECMSAEDMVLKMIQTMGGGLPS